VSEELITLKRKATMKTVFCVLCGLGCWWFGGGTMAIAGDVAGTNAAPIRVGVYDSRAVAYAWFGSDEHQRQLKDLMQVARAARAAGQTNRFKELGASIRQQQDEIHREFFSTAPATNALAAIGEVLPAIKKQAGVTLLVSKWDEPTLQQYPDAEEVDVTAELVREFKPTEKQLKLIADLQKQKPLSLEKCNELIRKGEI